MEHKKIKKTLLLVENESQHEFEYKHTLKTVKRRLTNRFYFTHEEVDGMKVLLDFWRLTREEKALVIFDPQYIIVTKSSYCMCGNYDSSRQFLSMMANAGSSSQLSDLTYIDVSGGLPELFNSSKFRDYKNNLQVLCGLSKHNVITARNEARGEDCFLMKPCLSDYYSPLYAPQPMSRMMLDIIMNPYEAVINMNAIGCYDLEQRKIVKNPWKRPERK